MFDYLFQWNGSNDSLLIRFPDKSQTDKLGLNLAWTIEIDIPKVSTDDLP